MLDEEEKEEEIHVPYSIFVGIVDGSSTQEKEEFINNIVKILQDYRESDDRRPIIFPLEFSGEARQKVQDLALQLNLTWEIKGGRESRYIVVKKPTGIPKEFFEKKKKITTKTFFDVPGEVMVAFVLDATHTSLQIGWEIPDCNNRPITSYIIEVKNGSNCLELESTVNQVLAKDLNSNTVYFFTIRAVNEEGPGYINKVFLFRTLQNIDKSGGVFSWGLCGHNELGKSDSIDGITPELVLKPSPNTIKTWFFIIEFFVIIPSYELFYKIIVVIFYNFQKIIYYWF